jgi:Iron-sulfur cluster assembly accessory protein
MSHEEVILRTWEFRCGNGETFQQRGGTVYPVAFCTVNVAYLMTIAMTDRAANQVRTVAGNENVDLGDTMLRIAVVPGGCSGLTYDLGWDTTVQDEDTVEQHEDVTVVLDKKSRLYLDGSELDFTDGLNGDGFHFTNPQATRECACGESFAL